MIAWSGFGCVRVAVTLFSTAVCGAGAAGCARGPSPFAAVAGPAAIGGVYRNDDERPGGSLWQLLNPETTKRAAEGAAVVEDRPEDLVDVRVAADGRRVTARLLRNGNVVAKRASRFGYSSGNDRLVRTRTRLGGLPFPLLWGIGHRWIALGRDAESPQRLRVTHDDNGVFFVLIMPVFAAGGGVGDHVFEPAPAASPTTTRTNATAPSP